ncbi:MAG: hypothetical protein R3C18_02430 [Planctomycetaceae bacterium]
MRRTVFILMLLQLINVQLVSKGEDLPTNNSAIVGQYAGLVENQVMQAEVKAVGGGEYELTVFPPGRGLNGAGAKTAKGRTDGAVTKFVDGTRTATLQNGILTLFESGKAVAKLKKVEKKPVVPPAGNVGPPVPVNGAAKFSSTTLPFDGSKLVRKLLWSADGMSLFVLQTDGLLRKLTMPDLNESKQVSLNGKCSDCALTSAGPVVLLDATQHIVLLDEDLNEVKRKQIPGVASLTSAPSLDHAFLVGDHIIGAWSTRSNRIRVFSATEFARTAARVKRTTPAPAGVDFFMATATPDGQFLLTSSSQRITRFRIRQGGLFLEEQGWQIGHSGSPTAMNVGGSPPRVSLTFGGGNEQPPGHPKVGYGTYIYDVTDLSVPVTTIEPGPYPATVGFDTAVGLYYGQTTDQELVVFNEGGAQLGSFDLSGGTTNRNERTQLIVPHPAGGRTLVLTDMTLYWCTLPEKWFKQNLD